MSSLVFYLSCVSFCLGIFCASFFNIGFSSVLFLLLLFWAIFMVGIFLATEKEKNIIGLIMFSFLFFSLGVVRFLLVAPLPILPNNFLDTKVEVKGRVVGEPVSETTYQKFIIKTDKISLGRSVVKEHLNILIKAERYPRIFFGDFIVVRGKINKIENFASDTGREFDYINYLGKEGVSYEMSFAVVSEATFSGFSFRRGLFSVKDFFVNKIYSILPDPHASFGAGILLGAKKGMPKDLQDIFMKAGIIHIVVLSGYNVAVVLGICMLVLSIFGLRIRLLFGALGIVVFAVLVGGGATVVRASVMAFLVIVAKATGRVYDVSRALFVAGFVMLLLNPKLLAFDPSFQLSFLAAFGIIHFYPAVSKYFVWLPEKYYIREFIGNTVAVQVFLLPLLLYMTSQLSIVSFPINILTLPVVPFAMGTVFVAGASAVVSVVLAMPSTWLSYSLLQYIILVARAGVSLPFSVVKIPPIPIWVMVIIYSFFGYLIYSHNKIN